MSETLLVGTRDWASADWADNYYPENLPEDWRFCYYSNQFRAVLVPWEVWSDIDAAGADAWLQDSDPEFRFVLEIPTEIFIDLPVKQLENRVNNLLGAIEPLRTQISGVLLGLVKGNRDAGFYSGLARLLSLLADQYPVCINDAESVVADELVLLASKYNASFCWLTDQNDSPDSQGHFMVALANEQDARRQRKILEDLAAWTGGSRVAGLFFEGPRAAQSAQQARIIGELAGII